MNFFFFFQKHRAFGQESRQVRAGLVLGWGLGLMGGSRKVLVRAKCTSSQAFLSQTRENGR